jgi:hypothetical protein
MRSPTAAQAEKFLLTGRLSVPTLAGIGLAVAVHPPRAGGELP